MAKKKKCGTYAAAARHQRNGEPLDAACEEALREYRAAAQARRRAALRDAAPVVAWCPAGDTGRDGWHDWETRHRFDPSRALVRCYRPAGPDEVPDRWIRQIDHLFKRADVDTAVTWWLANDQRAGEVVNAFPDVYRGAALHRLGYGSHPIPLGTMQTSLPATSSTRVVEQEHLGLDQPSADLPADLDTPPLGTLTATPWVPLARTWCYKNGGEPFDRPVVEVDGHVFPEPGRRVMRAAPGTPIPEGWEPFESDTATGGLARAVQAPIRFRDSDEAVEAWLGLTHSAETVVVLNITPTHVEAWMGIASAASLGRYTNPELMWEHIDARRSTDDERRWLGDSAPERRIILARSPGWDATEGAETLADTTENRASLQTRFSWLNETSMS